MRPLLLFIFLLTLSGCVAFREMKTSFVTRHDAQSKLAAAQQELQQGRTAAAATLLEEIVSLPAVNGVTDEALFRLSMLKLHSEETDASLPSAISIFYGRNTPPAAGRISPSSCMTIWLELPT